MSGGRHGCADCFWVVSHGFCIAGERLLQFALLRASECRRCVEDFTESRDHN
jgi:hypothetical protein